MARFFGSRNTRRTTMEPFDPTHRFVTSWLVSPYILFGIRAFMSLYAFTTLLVTIIYRCTHPSLGGCTESRASFSYFTVLTYWGLAFYYLISSIHTFTYITSSSSSSSSLLHTIFPRPLQTLHSLFYSTITTYPILVTIVFWALLSSPDTLSTPYSTWSNISQHGLNTYYAVFEILVPRTDPMPWIHLPFLILILALYLSLAYLTNATKGFYTYDFLDPGMQKSLVAAYVFGIALGICVIFAVVWALVWTRRWVTETKFGMRGVFVKGDDNNDGGIGRRGGGGGGGGDDGERMNGDDEERRRKRPDQEVGEVDSAV
ncbi:hypothetical protein GGS20DRAFT_572615 [Poronia punctata]|nr:hypothetical protein GGS20DRAFT_572615 [Poronia punctata]